MYSPSAAPSDELPELEPPSLAHCADISAAPKKAGFAFQMASSMLFAKLLSDKNPENWSNLRHIDPSRLHFAT